MTALDQLSLDLSAPAYKISARDRAGLGEPNETKARAKLTIHVLETAAMCRHQGGMDPKDGRIWGRFLDAFAEAPVIVEVSVGDFEWLCRLVSAEDLRLPVGVQHWRVALERYLDSLKLEQKLKA